MPEADPFDFVNTDCRLFFFFFSSFTNAMNTCSSRISPRMKYSFSCKLLAPDFVHASYRNFQCHWCSLKEKYGIDTVMTGFQVGLQRRDEMSIFTSPISDSSPPLSYQREECVEVVCFQNWPYQ